MKKKFLAIAMMLALVLALAITVGAEGAVDVARVGDTRYTSLQAALDASNGIAVHLLADCEEDIHLDVDRSYTLYLNDYTITGTVELSRGVLYLNGTGTVQNTGVDGKYPISCLGGNYWLGSVTVKATAENGVAIYSNGSKLTTNASPIVYGGVQVDYFGVFNINGGTYNGSLVCNPGGSLVVNGGSFSQNPSELVPVGFKSELVSGYYVVSADDSVTIDALDTDSNDGAYLIKTPSDVVVFRTLLSNSTGREILSGKKFKLANDIDMDGITLAAAGNDNKRFNGSFDGQGYTISNVNIQAGETTYVAFFGNTTGATIKDLTLHNVTVSGGNYTAGLVGFTRNTIIDNCAITGNIDISGGAKVAAIHAGGVVTITDCTVNGTGTISGSIDVGGISGLLSGGSTTVSGNSVTGITVNGNGLTGGLIGRAIADGTTLHVVDNTLTNVSVVSTASSYEQNGLAVGCLQTNASSTVCYDNTFVNSTLTVDGVVSDTVYCNSNHDGSDSSGSTYNAVAYIGTERFFTLQAAIDSANEGDIIQLLPGTFECGSIKFPAVMKNVTIKGATAVARSSIGQGSANAKTILKNSSFNSHDGSSVTYEGITIDGIVFDNSYILFTGQRDGTVIYKDWAITNCEFKNITSQAAVLFNLNSSSNDPEHMQNFTFSNNVIDGVLGTSKSGVVVRAVIGEINITGNTIKNVNWNAIQLLNSTGDTTVSIDGNTIENIGAGEGILNLYGIAGDVEVTNNVVSQNPTLPNQPLLCNVTTEFTAEGNKDIYGNKVDIRADGSMDTIIDISSWLSIFMALQNTTYNVTALASEGGTITPAGITQVKYYNDITYTITADEGYYLVSLTVDGEEIDPVREYTFKNVRNEHSIIAMFEEIPWDNPFTDISEDDEYYAAIEYIYEYGLFEGVAADKFGPNETMTRAMFATVLWRLAGEPVVEYDTDFTDVEEEKYYTEAVRWAASEGIILGHGDGTYGVSEEITVEQAMTIIYRYVQKQGRGFEGLWMFLLDYEDVLDISPWAYEAICWCKVNKIYEGVDGKIEPAATASRALVATMFYNLVSMAEAQN